MIAKLTLKQALRLISQMRDQMYKLVGEINSTYKRPILVDGNNSIPDGMSEKALDTYNRLLSINANIVSLRKAVAEANKENSLDELNIELQELRKLEKALDKVLEPDHYSDSIQIVSGVGLVEKGIVEESELLEIQRDVEKTINEIQDVLDKANTEVEVTVFLTDIDKIL